MATEKSTPSAHSVVLQELSTRVEGESGGGLELLRDIRNNPICSLYYDETVPCVAVEWKGYATSAQLRYIHEKMLELLTGHACDKVLEDNTELPAIHADDREWVVNDWAPRAIAGGLRMSASKAPTSYFGRQGVDSIQALLPADLSVRTFESLDDARAWLRGNSETSPQSCAAQ